MRMIFPAALAVLALAGPVQAQLTGNLVGVPVSVPAVIPPWDGGPDLRVVPFLNIERNGGLYIKTEQTSLETIAADLDRKFGTIKRGEQLVMVRANAKVPYKDVMAVLQVLNAAGYTNIGMISEDL